MEGGHPVLHEGGTPSFPGFVTAPGAVAQPGERLLCKQKVVGSKPISSTSFTCVAFWPRGSFYKQDCSNA